MPKLVHRGANHRRTEATDNTGQLEKAAADWWEEHHEKNPGHLYRKLRRIPNRDPLGGLIRRIGEKDPPPITAEEATAAASVFQWMFTAVGRGDMINIYHKAGWKITIKPPPLPPRVERKERKEHKTSPPFIANMPAEDD